VGGGPKVAATKLRVCDYHTHVTRIQRTGARPAQAFRGCLAARLSLVAADLVAVAARRVAVASRRVGSAECRARFAVTPSHSAHEVCELRGETRTTRLMSMSITSDMYV
jgi:hypothetical protein